MSCDALVSFWARSREQRGTAGSGSHDHGETLALPRDQSNIGTGNAQLPAQSDILENQRARPVEAVGPEDVSKSAADGFINKFDTEDCLRDHASHVRV